MNESRFSAVALAMAVALAPVASGADTVTLRYSNWLPDGQSLRVQAIEPWIEEVERVTEGRVRIESPPKVIGSVPAQFDVVRDGQADMALWVNGYTPGRFVVSEMLELPFISGDSEAYSAVMYSFYQDHLAQYGEYDGVQVVNLFSPGAGPIFNKVRPVAAVADLEGLKLRSPQPAVTQGLELLGAVPISKPVSELYELVSSGVIDGTVLPTESVSAFKLDDLLPHATEIPGGLYNTVLVLGINENSWNRISEEDRAAIMEVSGSVFSRESGLVYKRNNERAKAEMIESGVEWIVADDAFVSDLQERLQPIEDAWIEKAKDLGVEDPAALLQQLRAAASAGS